MSQADIIITTKRTTLHQFSPQDAKAFYHLNLNPENIRFTGDSPFNSIEQAADFIAKYDHYQQHGFGRWSVYLKPNAQHQASQYIGFCGLRKNTETGLVDIGYRIDQNYWGLGLATETANAVLAYGFQQLSLPLITSRARQDNPASIAVLKKIGFTQIGKEQEDGYQWSIFELKASNWTKNQPKYPI